MLAVSLLVAPLLHAQDLHGAWTATESDAEVRQTEHTLIFTDAFFSEAIYGKPHGKFIGTKGGSYTLNDGILDLTYEFANQDPNLVGETRSISYTLKNNILELGGLTWTRIDDGAPGDLFGAWLISGRKHDGEIVKRDTSGPRKTMKILSGTHFQWIAFNTETKQFMGTGGGTYTTIDGKYTENIGFFPGMIPG